MDTGADRRAAYQRSSLVLLDGRRSFQRRAVPLWACWNGELDQRYTLGVEAELMLLDPVRWSLAQSSDEVLEQLSPELSPQTSPETHAAVVEIVTGIHTDVDGVIGELAWLRADFGR